MLAVMVHHQMIKATMIKNATIEVLVAVVSFSPPPVYAVG